MMRLPTTYMRATRKATVAPRAGAFAVCGTFGPPVVFAEEVDARDAAALWAFDGIQPLKTSALKRKAREE